MNRYFDKFLTTVLISSLLSTPGYSVMNPQDAPVEFDRKILVTSAQDDSGQKIIVMSTPDDESQKIIAMISSRDEEQKILITSINKDLQDEGQRIYANLFQSRGIRVLSFKEVSSLLSPIFSPGNKIYFGKGNKEGRDTTDDNEEMMISIPSGEKERVPVDINIMTRDWYDDYLRGQDEERQRELMNDIEYQIENLDEDEKYVWVEKIKNGNESYEQVGGVLVDKQTEERMFVKLLPEDENGERKISIVIEDRHGEVVSEVIDIPDKEELKNKINLYVKRHTHKLENSLMGLLAVSGVIPGSGSAIWIMINHNPDLLPVLGVLAGIVGAIGGGAGGVIGGRKIGESIHAKQFHSHIRHLFDRNSTTEEKRISSKDFHKYMKFLSEDLFDFKKLLEQEKKIEHKIKHKKYKPIIEELGGSNSEIF